MPTNTTNYGLLKPLVNNATDQDLWGGMLNGDMDSIDTLLRTGITMETQTSQASSFAVVSSISTKRLYPCDATAGALTATLPLAADAGNGTTVAFKKTDAVTANLVTIAVSGSDTIDGVTSVTLSAKNDDYVLVSDGVSAWLSLVKPQIVQVIPDASTSVKGIIQIATAAEAIAGVDTLKAVTSAGLASVKSLAANGYYKFPGGLMIQWGFSPAGGDPRTVSFPVAFPNNCWSVVANSTINGRDSGTNTYTTTSFSLIQTNAATDAHWIAIGN